MSDANLSNLWYKKESDFAEAIAGIHSTGILTLTGNALNTETVTIGGVIYTFLTTLAGANRSVKIGARPRDSLRNLAACINAEPGNGVNYVLTAVPALPDALVVAEVSDVADQLTVSVKNIGASTTTAETLTNGSWNGGSAVGGVVPSGVMIELRFNKETLSFAKESVESEEIRDDRSIGDIVQVGLGAAGGVECELIMGDLEPWVLSTLMAGPTWTSGIVDHGAGAVVSVDATTQQVTSAGTGASTFPAGLISNARFVRLQGFANAGNNGVKRIINSPSNAAGVLQLAPGSIVTNEAAVATADLVWKYARNGVVRDSYLIEKEMQGAKIFAFYRGMCLESLTLNAAAKAKVMAAFSFLGYDSDKRFAQIGGSVVAPSTNPVITSSNNIGFVNLDDIAAVSPITNLTFEIKNNLRNRPAIARQGTLAPGTGTSHISGKLDAYFDTFQLFEAFRVHKRKSLQFSFVDANLKFMGITCPKIRFTEGNPNIPGTNQDIIVPLSFRAVKDPDDATGYQVQIDVP